jgi:hypothetical protein
MYVWYIAVGYVNVHRHMILFLIQYGSCPCAIVVVLCVVSSVVPSGSKQETVLLCVLDFFLYKAFSVLYAITVQSQ